MASKNKVKSKTAKTKAFSIFSLLTTSEWYAFAFVVIMLSAFFTYYTYTANYEFLYYIGIVVGLGILVIASNRKIRYSPVSIWGLAIWAFLHMAGGSLKIGGIRMYDYMIITISQEYSIFRMDQAIHIFGFCIATLVIYDILKNLIKKDAGMISFSIIIVMAGIGTGALNEVIEFLATIFMHSTGVGGYLNTSMDLVSNLIGALIALIIIRLRLMKK